MTEWKLQIKAWQEGAAGISRSLIKAVDLYGLSAVASPMLDTQE